MLDQFAGLIILVSLLGGERIKYVFKGKFSQIIFTWFRSQHFFHILSFFLILTYTDFKVIYIINSIRWFKPKGDTISVFLYTFSHCYLEVGCLLVFTYNSFDRYPWNAQKRIYKYVHRYKSIEKIEGINTFKMFFET